MVKKIQKVTQKNRFKRFSATFLALSMVLVMIILGVNSIQIVSAFEFDNGLLHYWDMNETSGTNADDRHGTGANEYDGTLINGAKFITGKIGNGIEFDGTNDWVNISGWTDLPDGTENFTISFWVNITADVSFQALFGSLVSNEMWAIEQVNDGNMYCYVDNTAEATFQSGLTRDGSTWAHVVWARNSTTDGIFINGAMLSGGTPTASITAGNIALGREFNYNNLTGMLDEFGIWSRALSAGEIIELYNSGNGLAYAIIPNNMTFNATTYETQTESFILNVSSDTVPTNAVLNYGGTNYTATVTAGATGNYTLTRSLGISSADSKSFYFTWDDAAGIHYSRTGSQTVTALNFGFCNTTSTVPYLNITFLDETSLGAINASVSASSWDYWAGEGTIYKSFSFSTTNSTANYSFCVDNPGINITTNVSFSYVNDSYPQRTYSDIGKILSNVSTIQTLYLLATADGNSVLFQVTNTADQLLSGVSISANRSVGGTVTTISTGITGADGTLTLVLDPDISHTFLFTKAGYPDYLTTLSPTQSSYTITLGSSAVTYNSTIRGITTDISPKNNTLLNDTAYDFIFNVSSSFWDVSEFGFNLRLANGSRVTGGSSATVGTPVTLNYDVNNQSIIYMEYYWVIDGNYTNATRNWVVTDTGYTQWSINNFFTDLKTYIDSGLFGLDNFGRYLIIFIIIFTTVGIMSYKFGLSSPLVVSASTFFVIFLFDVVLDMIPTIRGVDNLLTFISGIVLVIIIFREVQR